MTEEIKQEAQQAPTIAWKTRHVRLPDMFGETKGGITLRYNVTGDMVSYRYAICNPSDQYSRKVGIQVADSKPTITVMSIPSAEGAPTEFIVNTILVDIFEEGRETLSKYTISLIYQFIVTKQVEAIRKFFFPSKH
jgi:hypothetical protein